MTRQTLNVVVVGHLNHGKSTLVGRLFCDLGFIDADALERLKRHAEAAGKPALYLSFFTDTSLSEREQGLTIETAVRRFETESKRFSIIDVPGHPDYIRNMISGTAMADAAVLVMDGVWTAENGAAPQTKEHLVLCKAFGIKHLIVAVNKLDVVDFDKKKFEECRRVIEYLVKKLAYETEGESQFIPISALEGDNVVGRSGRTPWYTGPALFKALDSLSLAGQPSGLPLRMPVLRVFNIPGAGAVVSGKIETGTVKPGDSVTIAPYSGAKGVKAEVGSIEWHHSQIDAASAGDDVGILLGNAERGFMPRLVKKGAVLGASSDPPRPVKRLKARLSVVDHPSSIGTGYAPYLHVHQAAMPCTIEEIVRVAGSSGEMKFPKNGAEARLVNGDTGIVWIRPHKPLVIEKFESFPQLGRLVLRDSGTVAIGVCLDVEPLSKA